MAGIKVTLFRISVEPLQSGRPVERLFENATSWVFSNDALAGNLFIQKVMENGDNKIIAEFPSGNIESVEFA